MLGVNAVKNALVLAIFVVVILAPSNLDLSVTVELSAAKSMLGSIDCEGSPSDILSPLTIEAILTYR